MSSSNPPDPNVNTFNNLYWIGGDTSLTQDVADKRYLRFPTAQGTENLAAINVNGIASFNNEFVQTGATNNILQDLTTNTDPNLLKATNIYGDLNVNKPTASSGGALRLADVNTGAGHSKISASGLSLEFVNFTTSGKYTFTTSDGANIQTIPLEVSSALTTISNPISLTSTTPPVSSQVIPAANDSSTKMPTTAWVQSAITSILPRGSVLPYAGNTTVPTGFLFCDGAAVSRTTYAALFAVIGVSYGGGDGSTTFNLPKMISNNADIGIFPAGSAFTTNTGFRVTGDTINQVYPIQISSFAGIGSPTQKFFTNQLPPHTHTLTFPTANYVSNVNTSGNTTTGGSGQRAVSGPQSAFPPFTGNPDYGNQKQQADYTPIYTAFTWIIKF